MMSDLSYETDAALRTNDSSALRLLFKVFVEIYEHLLPCAKDKPTREGLIQAKNGNRAEEIRMINTHGYINLTAINEFFVKASNGVNNGVNS